ncbi:putative protein kinase RLK-Pelle-CrRLK1L-1 family [Helianthus anomalus]
MSFQTGQEARSSQSLDCLPQCLQLTFLEIQVATNNFDESLVVGHGGFGKVYRGTITSGESVLDAAIKRLESTSGQGAAEFWAEVEMLSKLRHHNLVSLIGYCNDGKEFILVYEYMPNGTLSDRLHKCRLPLTWLRRLKISIGAARGLEYLHTGAGRRQGVVHRDVKSSNILLDRSWASKVSDFGLSKIVQTNQTFTHVSTLVKGTFGYLDPDYFQTGRLTRKSDVYAFGVILFELLCGRKAVDTSLDEEQMGLARWAQDSIKEGRLKQIVDYDLRGRISFKCVKEFAQLARQCLHSNPKKRPTMSEVVVGLESILALHEKSNNTLDRKIFGLRLPAFGFPSSHENSVVGKSLTSIESYLYTVGGEDHILRRFDFGTINVATENFSTSNMLSEDYYGVMYKGKLQNGQDIAIVGPYPHEKIKLCMNEVSILVKVEHQNLAQLLGWCIEGTNVYLLYDIPQNYTTLRYVLSDHNRAPLDWDERYRILLGVARALLYLHKHAPIRVLHCDVKPGNILLDEGLEPKLHGFYIAVSAPNNETDCIELDVVIGTMGYMAPEFRRNVNVSTKADVFSFGVLVLQTITGRKQAFYIDESEESFTQYIWRNWVEGTYSNIIDTRLSIDSRSIARFVHMGLWCIQAEATDRPTMEEVVGIFLGSSSINLPILKDPNGICFQNNSDCCEEIDSDSEFVELDPSVA